MVAEFAQVAIRIPKVFISARELDIVPNPAHRASSTPRGVAPGARMTADDVTDNGYAGYSAHYMLQPVDRPIGQNTIAMVAWDVTLYTPECLSFDLTLAPQPADNAGRPMVLISNDITVQAGSFGAKEDALFDLASQRARAAGIPRIYLAANSGARIGLAEELKGKFKLALLPGDDDHKAFEYLYLDEQAFQQHSASVVCTRVDVDGEARYVITDVIGAKDGLGVENLRGSGCIAGETSRAYEDIFTMTFVTCRSVGIGAYLARLGQRVLQKSDPSMPLLLTGYQALNKLLGRQVYSSNVQLGGPDVMYTNGVTHQTVASDLEGCIQIVKWLSYVPVRRHAPAPRLLQALDTVDRAPSFAPASKTAIYDPHSLLVGDYSAEAAQAQVAPDTPLTGFFDRGSFMEVMGGWAKGIVAGRARLGGCPVGVLCVDPRTTEHTVPADPAGADSKETVVTRAGQVWYPESSYKTAQAIFDLAAEDLPLVLMANFRGFAGDSKAMHDMVLKYGAFIVDSLKKLSKPVIVYLPPHATLRGGAWVVVDETINADWMEMYADTTARGGVLEPEGIVDVKYRKPQIIAEMMRLDPKMVSLAAALKSASEAQAPAIRAEIKQREKLLFPTYVQVATHFADLHDTPARMLRKGCLRDIVPWDTARTRFYWRLRARELEQQRVDGILAAAGDAASLRAMAKQEGLKLDESAPIEATTTQASDVVVGRAILQAWLPATVSTAAATNSLEADKALVEALEAPATAAMLDAKVEQLKSRTRVAGAVALAQGMSKEQVQELMASLQKML
jgi:acetyl-CoA carboxylase/biotin carboxylase 1